MPWYSNETAEGHFYGRTSTSETQRKVGRPSDSEMELISRAFIDLLDLV